MTRLSGRRRWGIAVALGVATLVAALIFVDQKHTYEFRTEAFTFESGGNTLEATIALPKERGTYGVVLFIHGDGPIDAHHGDVGYRPIWEALAEAGFASISWDKPGVGQSTGDWLDQTMADRADEAVDVVTWLADHPDLASDIDLEQVGLIGFSQAGWVLPLITEAIPVQFVIAGSPAINWLAQARYLTSNDLAANGASPELQRKVEQANEEGIELLKSVVSHDSYLGWWERLDSEAQPYFAPMSADRYRFVAANYTADATASLVSMRNTPVLVLLGEDDRNVDVASTKAVYQDLLGGQCLTVKTYRNTDHSLLDHSGIALTLVGIFAPRSIYADGVLSEIANHAATANGC